MNKVDLLPPSSSDARSRDAALVNYVRAEMARHNIRVAGVQLVSAAKGHGLPDLMHRVARVALPDKARRARNLRNQKYSRDKKRVTAVPV